MSDRAAGSTCPPADPAFRVAAAGRADGYPVFVTRDLGPALAACLAPLRPTARVLVSDERVAALHLPRVVAALEAAGQPPSATLVLPPGEATKTLAAHERLCRGLLAAGCDREAVVLAVGGGVVGDLAGFAAATYLRGIAVVHLPTTLLAQVDSAIGGKTGVNLDGKNLVGAFHPPAGVVADLEALGTLPPREVRSGLGEVLKTAVLAGPALQARVEEQAARLRALDLEALAPVVLGCLRHKAAVVGRDEREAGERALLNLGHTLGHALEVADGQLAHGEAVAIGVLFAARLARELGLAPPGWPERLAGLAAALDLPLAPPRPVDRARLRELLGRDKKARGGRLRWVLPRGPGRCELVDDVPPALVERLLDQSIPRG